MSMHRKVTFLVNGLAIFALLLGVLRSPALAASSDLSVAPAVSCMPVASLTVSGSGVGVTSTFYSFQAVAGPANASLNISFYWEVTDKTPLLNTGVSAITDTQEFSWNTPGLKTIKVGVKNCVSNDYTVIDTFEIMIGELPLRDVPEDVRQRALLLLEEQRASGQSPEWAQARLSDNVTPLFRPDMDAPAYFEFQVVAFPPTAGTEVNAVQEGPAGFIIVSTSEHDYPITNWSTGGLSPSERLRQAAQDAGKVAVKFFKLDVLSYVAEDDDGEMVARDGALPPRITGIPAAWLTNPPPIVEKIARPLAMVAGDPADGSITQTIIVSVTNAISNPLQFEAWGSWDELKTGYAEEYEPFIQVLQRKAAIRWQIERSTLEYGYVLLKDESFSFPLIWPNPVPSLSGPGVSLVASSIITPTGSKPQLVITATNTMPDKSVPLTATITYSNGMSETVRVLVVHRCVIALPVVSTLGDGVTTSSISDASTVNATIQSGVEGTLASDGYTYWYATGSTKTGADNKQAWYDQYFTNCHSGCGATAWAMLIAWGDRQAAYQDPLGGNALWEGRWGLYRFNGGRSATDRIAPTYPDDALEATGVSNMTWEIADWVDTWCAGINDNGATWPDDMWEVIGYLNGRSGMEVKTWHLPLSWDPVGYSEQNLVTYARNVIQNPIETRRPTVIGTGFFSHYPLAYGYRTKPLTMWITQCDWEGCETYNVSAGSAKGFYVNQGWGNSSGEWVEADLFFTGRLTPHRAYVDDVALYRPSNRYFYFDYGHDGLNNDSHSPFGWPTNIRPVVGDFDKDGLLDDVGAFIFAHDNVGTLFDWRFDYNNDASNDKQLDRWTYNDRGWPMALDVDRDGWVDDIALYDPLLKEISWNIDHKREGSSDGSISRTWYPADGRPVTGDFDHDGFHDDIALFSPSTGMWTFDYYPYGSLDRTSGPWGTPGDLPIAGDFDGDGYVDDIGLYNGNTGGDRKWRYDFNANATSLGQTDKTFGPYGDVGDLPFAGNFDTQ